MSEQNKNSQPSREPTAEDLYGIPACFDDGAKDSEERIGGLAVCADGPGDLTVRPARPRYVTKKKYQGTVIDGAIVLDSKEQLPNGARVEVALKQQERLVEAPDEPGTLRELLLKSAGCMTDLPEGVATQQDQPMTTIQHVRLRPAMYLGDIGTEGLHRLAWELVENYCLAEFWFGDCREIRVQMNLDGSLSIVNDGKGIPVDACPNHAMTTLEWVMTCSTGVEVRDGTRIYESSNYGAGARAVTALSDWVKAEVCCNGHVYRQRYECGMAVGDVCEIGPAGAQTSTKITFHPDREIFSDVSFDCERLKARLQELAFLNKGLSNKLIEERTGKEETFCYARGVVEYIVFLNQSTETLHRPIFMEKQIGDLKVEIAMQYSGREGERIRCYANNAFNSLGGTHLNGFRAAVLRALERYGREKSLFRNGQIPNSADFCEGLTAILNVKIPDPMFESQAKLRLNNPQVECFVADIVDAELSKFLSENPADAHRIILKVVSAAEARY